MPGGVGHLAIQLARASGAEVFSTVRSGHEAIVESLGATSIDHIKQWKVMYVIIPTVKVDTVGGAVLDASFSAVKHYTGRVVSIMGWSTHSLAPLSFRGANYSGVFSHYPLLSGIGRKHHGQILSDTALLISTGKLRPVVDERSFFMESIDQAYECGAGGNAKGKIIISIHPACA